MWFQQTLWKLPPDYGGPGGLRHWVEDLAGKYALYGWYRTFVNEVVLPNFSLFAFQVWAGETLIAVTLFFGVAGRLGGLLGGIMGLNLYIAMSKAPHEWYWSYLFMSLLCFIFFFTRAGRFLGVDQILAPKVDAAAEKGNKAARVLRLLM
jgi:thiosulfate dehydrogenase [quinone] large subunit